LRSLIIAGCVLRAFGVAFSTDAFLADSRLAPCKVWHVGEPRTATRPPYTNAGFNLVTSNAPDLPTQIKETMDFLASHRVELLRLSRFPGLDGVTLDFGISRREVAAQRDHFSADFVRLAAEFKLAIELSQYL
jgi:hypothetical protein